MKKLIKILIILLVFSLNPAESFSQNNKKDTIVPDMKYWFSQTQLINSVMIALEKGTTVKRWFINGNEFTESGYTKCPKGPKDSRFVARIPSSANINPKYLYFHPDDVAIVNSNVKFIKWLY